MSFKFSQKHKYFRVNSFVSYKILLVCCLFLSCSSVGNKQPGKLKPKNVPDSSFWVGGVDGGNWYYVKYVNNHRNMARIAVYNDQDGTLIIDTTFMLICIATKYTFINNLRQQISAFDGNKIYFVRSDSIDCYLQPNN